MSHATAVLALLVDENLTVYDGDVPDLPAFPYVVAWLGEPLYQSDRLGGDQTNAQLTFQTSSVGLTPEQARWAQAKSQGLLLNRRLAGYTSARVKHDLARPPAPDNDVDPAVFMATDDWSVLTT